MIYERATRVWPDHTTNKSISPNPLLLERAITRRLILPRLICRRLPVGVCRLKFTGADPDRCPDKVRGGAVAAAAS